MAAGTGNSAPFASWSMRVGLVPLAGGGSPSLRSWGSSTESYAVTGHQGQAAMSVTIARPGRYLLAATNVSPRSITDIAVGRGIGHALLIPFLLIAVAVFVFLPAGLVVGGVTAYRRHRARRLPGQVSQSAVAPWPAMGASGPAAPYQIQPGPYPPGSYLATPFPYLQGGPVGFGEAIKQAFSHGFVYRGRASRSAYWWFVLFEVIAAFVLDLLLLIPLALKSGVVTGLFIAVFAVAAIYLGLVALALTVRRLHDTDRTGWWVLIALVPFGSIALLVFTFLKGPPDLTATSPDLGAGATDTVLEDAAQLSETVAHLRR